ncbi:protein croquemort-like isoform X2 [Neodiprion fabricii]|uniref:protein croquemort-like isoform X2 n=1 Tax=Neodiprion fabricii TaxID=2872261 RepID=UPI001ED8E920|nr:protein croquemort-like isoform X2 [Neodiprion fabricii]
MITREVPTREGIKICSEQNDSAMSTVPLLADYRARRAADDNKDQNVLRKPAKMRPSKTAIIILYVVGALLLIGGIAVGLSWMRIFNHILLKELILTPTSTSYDMWKETPIPMYLKLHLYNWTNTEEFSNNATTKPNFVEMGPYVFREEHIKVNQTWNDNGTITFQQRRIWHFDESMSNGSLDDEITNLNVIGVTVGHFVRNENIAVRLTVNLMLERYGESLFVTKTARELLFEGYSNAFLDFVHTLDIPGVNIPFEKFGWFYGRNLSDTYDGVFNMHTGVEDVLNLGVLENWNYRNRTDFWSGECSMIRGTTGELWPPVDRDESIEIFAPDICTSLVLSRANDTEILNVEGHRYITDRATFDNGSTVPSRACYCVKEPCQPSGMLDVSECRFGAPAYVSLPHFYQADDYYANAITGMEPREGKYNFEMVLEPTTGIPLNVKAQMQINILVEPVNGIALLTGIPAETYIPMLWFSQEAQLSEELASQMKMLLELPMLGHVGFTIIGAIGLVLLSIGICLCICRRCRSEENQSLIDAEDSNNPSKSDPVQT